MPGRTITSPTHGTSAALSRTDVSAVTRARAPSRVRRAAPVVWVSLLLASICFEGLGRKYLPEVPQAVFYFMKDGLLLVGLVVYGLRPQVMVAARWAYGAFTIPFAAGVLWTLMEMFNPSQTSLPLALIGFHAYWFWWLAPLVLASALRTPRDVEKALVALCIVSVCVALMAYLQFARPADDPINAYAWQAAGSNQGIATVSFTDKVRVISTFSYISGFTAFVTVIPAILLAIGLGQKRTWVRWLSLASVLMLAVAAPMSGSRAPIAVLGIALGVVVMTAGVIHSRTGRRAIVAGMVAIPLVLYAAPQAITGVMSRFEGPDTSKRILQYFDVLPPVTLTSYDYPLAGTGTGTMQNARLAFGVTSPFTIEPPEGRLVVEQGPIGYLLFWLARLGLVIGLLKGGQYLRRRGQRGVAGGAFALAALAPLGDFVFDHVWQSLYFTAIGLVFAALVHTAAEREPRRADVELQNARQARA